MKILYKLINMDDIKINDKIKIIINDIVNNEILKVKEIIDIDYTNYCQTIIEMYLSINDMNNEDILNNIIEFSNNQPPDIRIHVIKIMKKKVKEMEEKDYIISKLFEPILYSIDKEESHIVYHKLHLLNRLLINYTIKDVNKYINYLISFSKNDIQSNKTIYRLIELIGTLLSQLKESVYEYNYLNDISLFLENNVRNISPVYVKYSVSYLLSKISPPDINNSFLSTFIKLTLNLIDDDNNLVRENAFYAVKLFLHKNSNDIKINYIPNNLVEIFYDYLSNIELDNNVKEVIIQPLLDEWNNINYNNESVYDKDDDKYYTEKYYNFMNIIKCFKYILYIIIVNGKIQI